MKLTACIALPLGFVLLGCAADMPPPAVGTSTGALDVELSCAPFDDSNCDPVSYCDLGSSSNHDGQYVYCGSGIIMLAWTTPDCRWCINRDVCGPNDLLVCAF